MGSFGAWLLSLQAILFGLIVEFGGAYLFLPVLIAAVHCISSHRSKTSVRRHTLSLSPCRQSRRSRLFGRRSSISIRPAEDPPNPEWVGLTLLFTPWLVLLVGALFILLLRRVRLFALLYSIVNLYAAVVVCFVALMAVTGSWL